MRGQLSAEMLILIVVVLAVVALAASQLMKTGQTASSNIENQSDTLFWKSGQEVKSDVGEPCRDGTNTKGEDYDDCKEGLSCDNNKCK